MTESEWLRCDDPQAMLEFLWTSGKASDRKLRLFACACCRRIWPLLTDERSRRAVEVAEGFADGQVSREELAAACAAADRAHCEAPRQANFRSLDAAPHTAEEDLSCSAADAAASAADAVQIAARGDEKAKVEECQKQATLLHCIFASPFRPPPALDPRLLTPDLVALAQSIYEEWELPGGILDRSRLAVLADALEDAGCPDAELLGHLRGGGEHVRGCWAVDVLTGRG
jgi:hypothetical protein